MLRPVRSVLYIPASKERALEKARFLPADAIIFDLEDAVAPEEKDHARAILAADLGRADFGSRLRLVRMNGLDTAWGRADLAVFGAHVAVEGVLVPKVDGSADLDAVAGLTEKPLWAMLETPRGCLNAGEIADHPRLGGIVMGTNDLAQALGTRDRPDRLPLLAALGAAVLAAKAAGRVILDGVFNSFRDEAGFRAECVQGRDMGFDGKTLIHPAQLAIANEVFAPGACEIALARRMIASHREALAKGQGVAVLDGRIVEALHVATAETLLAKAEAIAARGI